MNVKIDSNSITSPITSILYTIPSLLAVIKRFARVHFSLHSTLGDVFCLQQSYHALLVREYHISSECLAHSSLAVVKVCVQRGILVVQCTTVVKSLFCLLCGMPSACFSKSTSPLKGGLRTYQRLATGMDFQIVQISQKHLQTS